MDTQMRPDFQLSGTANETEVEGSAVQLHSFSQAKQTTEGTSIVNIPSRLIGCRRNAITLVRENLVRSEFREITQFQSRNLQQA